jgi:Uma2 family endonuclease
MTATEPIINEEKRYTAEDLMRIEGRVELEDGKLIEMSPTKKIHNRISVQLLRFIMRHVDVEQLGEIVIPDTGFRLQKEPEIIRIPDMAFIPKDRITPLDDDFYNIAPDLAVEIMSPGNTVKEIDQRVVEYFAAGTRLMWVIYPKTRRVHVFTSDRDVTILNVGDTLTGGDVLPGFVLPLANLFAVLD